LDVDAETSSKRAWERSQNEDPKYKGDIDFLKENGYKPMSAEEIEEFVSQKA
jgi:predicted Ser/Thr protein kinase